MIRALAGPTRRATEAAQRVRGRLEPWLPRARRVGPWVVSGGSLALGLVTILVLRRGLPHAGWIVGYLVLAGLVFGVVAETRGVLEGRGRQLVLGVADYTIQTLCHGLLLFVLPAYYASATLTAPNGLFVLAVGAGILLTSVDPWYAILVRPRPGRVAFLLGFAVFAALGVALPLIGVRPAVALPAGAALAALAIAPALRRPLGSWRRAGAAALGLAALGASLAWAGRGLVPPAPLALKRAAIARAVAGLEPVDEVAGTVAAAAVAEWGGLVAWTAVYAPPGLRQEIVHVWQRDGAVVARIPLRPVRGGRPDGYRTFSRRTDTTPPLAGRYTVDVETSAGQLIGRLRFTVTP